ncbi:MAG: TIGR02453 family protein [Bacteroidetes bacterium]|jgi:uncharacterized protein (TIGR02453 family)|nr:TIGR02453 family protein [Bacteroidota bacterium]
MFTKETFQFLTALKENNYKEWFHANKKRYEAIKKEMAAITNDLIAGIASFDASVKDNTAKDCTFRINRDIRFSTDKSPYKTNLGAFIVEGGKKSGLAGYYLHVEPGNCFIGGGLHMPPSPTLKAVRSEIYNYTDEFLKIINDPNFKKYFGEIYGEQLKTAPKGFDKDFEHIDLLRYKSYTVALTTTSEELMKPDGFEKTLDIFEAMHPFIAYLNRGIKENQS